MDKMQKDINYKLLLLVSELVKDLIAEDSLHPLKGKKYVSQIAAIQGLIYPAESEECTRYERKG